MHRSHLPLFTSAFLTLATVAGTARPTLQQGADAGDMLVYFGTYTSGASQGIYLSRMNRGTGELSPPVLAGESVNPSFLAMHPTRDFLYAVNEIDKFEGKATGSVSAFAIDRTTGLLTALNRQPSAGTGPAHIEADPSGRHVLVANYGGGSVAVLPLGDDGSLKPPSSVIQHVGSSVNPQRQKSPHAHAITLDPSGRFAYVPDLGIDKVMIYGFDRDRGGLAAAKHPFAPLKPGAGPRHIAIHPSGRFAYVINELHCTISVYERNETDGALDERQTITTLPPGQALQAGYSTAEIEVHPSGRFVYGSNRGHDSIAVFAIDQQQGGMLTPVEVEPTQGRTPRSFGIDPSGTFLLAANQRSDSVVVFRIDPATGALTPTGTAIEVPSPVSVKFLARE
ncbi:MAG TPA: lactonase family protein [Vicinamibacterales bacterium]|nr:lactonase family protein [Vicinamibacterales bacterium]